ncbi:MAG: hypothetical protein A2289_15500 [Deltaproteobacteria bacterium RIFOXYA12_FULL_58_15]|nr:MAG: hypothetical protein A2289_15500 [Deltaproteobacteria bacterium RIFOXYA12_FULL_58_15]OGR12360.1 MAG: hypothetical protein A2341_03855 [Deltaproteobacteria bacterium RIFOXYB12_FULL_58_9]
MSKKREPVSQAAIDLLLPGADKPGRYIGGEPNSVVKEGPVRARVALCFPDVYEVAESHIGLKILYDILNRQPEFAAERVYALWPDLEQRARAQGVPLWSLETRRPLCAFDVVGITLQYELSYPTVLAMLEHGGVPVRAALRGDDDPFVVGGGSGALNPEPMVDFFDAFLIGDGEEAVLEIAEAVANNRGKSRADVLTALATIPGVYVPAFYEVDYQGLQTTAIRVLPGKPKADCVSVHGIPRLTRRAVADLDAAAYPTKTIVPNVAPVHERFAIEIQRGCTQGCRFCQAGMTTRPTRQRSCATVLALAGEGLRATGCDVVSLLSLSAGDYPALNRTLTTFFRRYQDERISVSLPSMRPQSMSPELATQVANVRKAAFTLAPEAGSERLRKLINKSSTDEDLIDAVQATVEAGWRHLKLYFMIGLPTETDEDLDGIVELAQRAQSAARKIRKDANVTVSVSTFIPKPHTPLQWDGQIGISETRRRQHYLRQRLREGGITLRYHCPEQSFVEGVLSRGDRRLGEAIWKVAQAGARLDAWTENFHLAKWTTGFAAALEPFGLVADDYLAVRDDRGLLAWDHIDTGVLKKFLADDRERASGGVPLGDCAHGDCSRCGGCDLADPYLSRDHLTGKRPVGLRPQIVAEDSDKGDEPEMEVALPEQGSTASTVKIRSRLRFRFAKVGGGIHLSHLDTASLMLRAIRRSKMPVLYTEGYTPRAKVGFSPACPTGITSEAEFFEADCGGFPDPAAYLDRLNSSLPAGLVVREGWELGANAPSLNEVLDVTTFVVELGSVALASAQEKIDAFLGASEVIVRVTRKGKGKLVDARKVIVAAELEDDKLRLGLQFHRGGSLKTAEAIATLFGIDAASDIRIHKENVVLRDEAHPQGPIKRLREQAAIDLTGVNERRTQNAFDE